MDTTVIAPIAKTGIANTIAMIDNLGIFIWALFDDLRRFFTMLSSLRSALDPADDLVEN
ncbi:MAG TPA: hypothetical protein VJV03_17430 [Pyrinomonadaceae bacterium]|nr:hypothetical protein [Pyrinomonadaceae bacterium]